GEIGEVGARLQEGFTVREAPGFRTDRAHHRADLAVIAGRDPVVDRADRCRLADGEEAFNEGAGLRFVCLLHATAARMLLSASSSVVSLPSLNLRGNFSNS